MQWNSDRPYTIWKSRTSNANVTHRRVPIQSNLSCHERTKCKVGRKDVLKIEDRELSQEELDRLALVAPSASIAIIRNYGVAEKRQIELGDELIDIARCSFFNCITQNINEPLPHKLRVITSEPLEIRCAYCGMSQSVEQIVESLV